MNRYTDELCPVCNKPFDDESDVVVCPTCGTPHHRACWFEIGECANKSKHAEGYEWKKTKGEKIDVTFDSSTTLGDICPRCGTNNPKDALFCSKCGLPRGESPNQSTPNGNTVYDNVPPFIHNEQNSAYGFPEGFSPDEQIDGVPTSEIARFVGANAKRYLHSFKKNKLIGWNWGAFIFGAYWYFFRKIYSVGAVFIALSVSIEFLLSSLASDLVLTLSKLISDYSYGNIAFDAFIRQYVDALNGSPQMKWFYIFGAAIIVLRIVAALFADYFMKKRTMEKIGQIKEQTKGSPMYQTVLMVKGGVSFLMPVLVYIAQYTLEIMVSYFISK